MDHEMYEGVLRQDATAFQYNADIVKESGCIAAQARRLPLGSLDSAAAPLGQHDHDQVRAVHACIRADATRARMGKFFARSAIEG